MRYKKYPKYKDSGVKWLGEIPEHWKIKKFKYLFEIRKRIAGKLGFNILSITQQGIKIKDIESGEGQLSSDYTKYQYVYKGDFAMNHMDLLTGFVDLSKYDGVTSPDYRVFLLTENKADAHYYLFLLQMGYMNKIFYPLGQGSSQFGRWRLPSDAFKEFLAPFPPYQEQIMIADFLDKQITKLNILMNKQKKLIELLKEKRQVKVDLAIKDKQTQFKHLKYAVKQIFRPVNRVSDTEYEALGLYNRGRGLFHKPLKPEDELGDSDFYWVKEGDLILSGQFAWEGAVALAGSDENSCIVSHRYPIIRGENNILNTEYLWAYLTTKEGDFLLNENSVGSAGRNRPLNINTLMKEKIPVPSIKLQKEVATIVKMEAEIKKSIAASISLLKERRNSLISAVVTGKIDVREFNE